MSAFLRYLNSFPIAFTSTHYQEFGDSVARFKDRILDSPESWEELRRHHDHYSVADTREEWLRVSEGEVKKDGQDGGMKLRAAKVAAALDDLAAQELFSVGVGGAGLEYQIKKLKPALRLICSEYVPSNVEMLRKVFTECEECIVFDIFHDDWVRASAPGTVALLYRIDAHFTDAQWRQIFEKLFAAGVRDIIFIPTGCLTLRSWVFRLRRRLIWFMTRAQTAFVGYVRTQKRFEQFWQGLYIAEERDFSGLKGFILSRNTEGL